MTECRQSKSADEERILPIVQTEMERVTYGHYTPGLSSRMKIFSVGGYEDENLIAHIMLTNNQ